MTVRKAAGGKYKLVSKTGKTLGVHDTPREAHQQEKAIKASQRRRGK